MPKLNLNCLEKTKKKTITILFSFKNNYFESQTKTKRYPITAIKSTSNFTQLNTEINYNLNYTPTEKIKKSKYNLQTINTKQDPIMLIKRTDENDKVTLLKPQFNYNLDYIPNEDMPKEEPNFNNCNKVIAKNVSENVISIDCDDTEMFKIKKDNGSFIATIRDKDKLLSHIQEQINEQTKDLPKNSKINLSVQIDGHGDEYWPFFSNQVVDVRGKELVDTISGVIDGVKSKFKDTYVKLTAKSCLSVSGSENIHSEDFFALNKKFLLAEIVNGVGLDKFDEVEGAKTITNGLLSFAGEKYPKNCYVMSDFGNSNYKQDERPLFTEFPLGQDRGKLVKYKKQIHNPHDLSSERIRL